MEPFGGFMLPPELRPYRHQVEAYAHAKLQQFAYAFARRLNPALTKEQIDYVAREALATMAALVEPVQMIPQQNLRLVLRHDCLSSGCGDAGCVLCQYNPSRICKRNLKQKYLIDDHLRAKCGAGLRVEVVDENGQCVAEPLPDAELEVHVLNGEKYKEVCPDNTLLNSMQLRGCIIMPNHKKPLLKRESALGGVPDDTRIFLPLEHGQAPLSDLQCTTSSEALLCGKAPTFRLLVWAIDRTGNHLSHITYVVSESFVVATKRVKHAIKSDIPSIADHISKLVHIGKATVDKLQDIRQAAAEENLDIDMPEPLNRVDKVGQFRQLVELTDQSSDLKHKLRHLLKLSPEKWEEVCQHALSAVVPDFRPRVWWSPTIQGGLLFACKNGAVLPEHPMAFVHRDVPGGPEAVTPIQQVDSYLFNLLPKLKQQAMQDWFAPGHTGWAVYWQDASDPLAQQLQPGPNGPTFTQQLPLGVTAAAAMSNAVAADTLAASGAAAAAAVAAGGVAPGMAPPPQGLVANGHQQAQLLAQGGYQQVLQQQQQQQQQAQQQQQQPAYQQQQYAPPGTPVLDQHQQQQQQQQAQYQQAQQQYQQQQQQQQQQHYQQVQQHQQQLAQQPYQQQQQQPPQMPPPASLPPQVGGGSAGGASGGGGLPPGVGGLKPSSAPPTATAAAAAGVGPFSGGGGPAVPPVSVPLPGQQRHSVPGYGTARSPFATQNLQQTLSAAFPQWQGALSPGSTPHSTQGGGVSGGGAAPGGGVSGGGAPPPQGQQQGASNGGTTSQQGASGPSSQGGVHPQPGQQQQSPPQHQQQSPQQHQAPPGSAGGAAGTTAAAAAAAAAAVSMPPEASKLQGMLPSLEMLNTEDLPPIDRGTSLWSLDSLQQMQMLSELPSVGVGSMLGDPGVGMGGAAGRHAGMHVAGAGAGANGVLDGQPDRALSLKFSMSLDLADVPDDCKGGGS